MTSLKTPKYGRDDVLIEHQTEIYRGFFKIERYQLQYRLYAGGWSNHMTRELFRRGLAAAALLYDPDRDEVVLIEQFRIGALSDRRSPWLIELVAGVVDYDEKPLDTIKREIQEEAGLTPIDCVPLLDYWVSPGGSSEFMHMFCARVDAKNATGLFGLPIENEDISVLTLPSQEAFQAVREGFINNAPAIIALQWLELNLKQQKKLWE